MEVRTLTLTDPQRVERAARAKRAMDEFFEPAFETIGLTYLQRLEEISAREPWATNKIAAVANAVRITKELRGQIEALIHDGAEAKITLEQTKRMEALSPTKRRLLGI